MRATTKTTKTTGIGAMWLYAAVGLVLMVIGFYAIDLTTPGPLRQMVKQGKPNAVVISAAGVVSMAFIVVLAIYSSGGRLAEGLLAADNLRLRRDPGTGGHDACRDHCARRQHVRVFGIRALHPRVVDGGCRAVRARASGGGRHSLRRRAEHGGAEYGYPVLRRAMIAAVAACGAAVLLAAPAGAQPGPTSVRFRAQLHLQHSFRWRPIWTTTSISPSSFHLRRECTAAGSSLPALDPCAAGCI